MIKWSNIYISVLSVSSPSEIVRKMWAGIIPLIYKKESYHWVIAEKKNHNQVKYRNFHFHISVLKVAPITCKPMKPGHLSSVHLLSNTQHIWTWEIYDAWKLVCPDRKRNCWSFTFIGDQAKTIINKNLSYITTRNPTPARRCGGFKDHNWTIQQFIIFKQGHSM